MRRTQYFWYLRLYFNTATF